MLNCVSRTLEGSPRYRSGSCAICTGPSIITLICHILSSVVDPLPVLCVEGMYSLAVRHEVIRYCISILPKMTMAGL